MVLYVIIVLILIYSGLVTIASDIHNIKHTSDYDDDPVETAMDHWDNDPDKLTMEDMFWLDEMWGDE